MLLETEMNKGQVDFILSISEQQIEHSVPSGILQSWLGATGNKMGQTMKMLTDKDQSLRITTTTRHS